jgi:hypothetical protein
VPAHAVVPAVQVKQSVPAALQPFGHVVVAGVGHWPFALQVTAAVLTPFTHDCAGPHEVPDVLLPVSVHTGTPVVHEFVPVLQGLAGWQVEPCAHGMQAPVRQKEPVPQLIPSGAARF